MKKVLMIVSYIGLAFTILPSVFVLGKHLTLQNHFWLMGVGLVLWFGSAPFWMKSKSLEETEENN